MISCKKDNPHTVDVSHIEVSFSVDRFDQDFYTSSLEDLPKLKSKYPYFFPKATPDSVWIQKKQDKDELELFAEVQKKYESIDWLTKDLESLFKHVKYYYPNFKSPNVTTVLTNIDYNYRVIYNVQSLLISLDVYLGKEHEFYNDYPAYIKENNTKEGIIVDVANEIIRTKISVNNDRTFLGKMIFEGKKLYLLDLFLPMVSEKQKSGFLKEKISWVNENEEQVWRYFIDKNLLYSTDSDLDKRFLDLAPFSKFYLQLDNDSPGQIGKWIGWQIVKSFMDNNDVSLQSLLSMKAQEILKKSKYKPRN